MTISWHKFLNGVTIILDTNINAPFSLCNYFGWCNQSFFLQNLKWALDFIGQRGTWILYEVKQSSASFLSPNLSFQTHLQQVTIYQNTNIYMILCPIRKLSSVYLSDTEQIKNCNMLVIIRETGNCHPGDQARPLIRSI